MAEKISEVIKKISESDKRTNTKRILRDLQHFNVSGHYAFSLINLSVPSRAELWIIKYFNESEFVGELQTSRKEEEKLFMIKS